MDVNIAFFMCNSIGKKLFKKANYILIYFILNLF